MFETSVKSIDDGEIRYQFSAFVLALYQSAPLGLKRKAVIDSV